MAQLALEVQKDAARACPCPFGSRTANIPSSFTAAPDTVSTHASRADVNQKMLMFSLSLAHGCIRKHCGVATGFIDALRSISWFLW
jgi:hypothetical protein